MSTQIKPALVRTPWPDAPRHTDVLPFSLDMADNRTVVSDTVKLRIANALQSSLHVRDVIKGFATEAGRLVRGISVRYRHKTYRIKAEFGPGELNWYTYDLNLVGRNLGEITFSRGKKLGTEELETLEVLLCALVYPLRNALQYESALKIALKDPLTGVSNRASMGAHLNHHISLAQRQHTPLSLLMVDIDHFKRINDDYGHIAGDVVLTQVARCIVSCTRECDAVFRYGGEEFAVVLPSTPQAGAVLLAERIRSSISALHFDTLPSTAGVTVSIGVGHLAENDTATELLQRADTGLLQAKRAGRDQVIVSQSSAAVASAG